MILDAILGLFGAFFALLAEAVAALFVPLINIVAAVVEGVVGLIVAGFRLGRMKPRGGRSDQAPIDPTPVNPAPAGIAPTNAGPTGAANGVGSRRLGLVALLIGLGFGGGYLVSKFSNRNVALIAADGHGLPYAAVIIRTSGGERRERTDGGGNIAIPRFTTESLTIKDPRYVEQTWQSSEIEPELTARRTLLGAGLDAFADRLLKPAEE